MASCGKILCLRHSICSNFRRLATMRSKSVEYFARHRYACSQVPLYRAALTVPFVPTVYAFWGKKKEDEPEEPLHKKSADQLLTEKADFLYSENRVEDLYDLLASEKHTYKPDILWRLARAATDKGKAVGKDPERRKLIYEAYEYIKRALEADDGENNYAVHKWYAILLDLTGEYEGNKQRITNAFKVKEHFMKAIALNPHDATSIHSLGYWCFLFADMPWYTRNVAAVVFTSPPTSTYEEALKYFMNAEEIEPNFYSMNLLMIGKTHLRLGNKKAAMLYLTRARDYTVRTPDDHQARKEATELLEGLGVKK